MNTRVLVAIALIVCAVGARAEETEESSLANVETVEPMFLEADASADEAGFPFALPKKLERTTVEPRYYGESAVKPKKYVNPEYRDPQPKKLTRKERRLRPVTFTSHYFSPLPKKVNSKKLRARRNKKNRSLVPFRHTVETPAGHRQHKGFTQAELFDGRLPNKYDDPRLNMKKTKAPAPQISFVEFDAEVDAEGEVDTTDEMEAAEEAEAPVPPPFQHDEGEIQATVVQAEEFFDANHQAPTWADEEASEAEMLEADAEVAQPPLDLAQLPRLVPVQPHVSAEDAVEQYENLAAFLEASETATASFVEIDEEAEEEDETEAEADAEEETEEESEDESEAEAEDEAEEEAEDEAEDEAEAQDEAEDEEAGIALVESAAVATTSEDSVDAEMDEMEANELAASQVDMDATSDEAAMTEDAGAEEEVESETVEEVDADEESSAEEADTTEEVIGEDEAVEDAENAAAVALVEESSDAEDVEALLAEVDAHVDDDSEAAVEAEGETAKGTPGHSIAAGQTWEEAQNARLNAMQSQLEAEKAATPKVTASVVAKEELHAGEPEYNSVEARVETVEPELLVETAAASSEAVLLEKIAKLKAIRRA